ncbi:MAG: prepilin-type N-terminal cleavage/methylation domain-containing protein [Phycisphaerales bacterium]
MHGVRFHPRLRRGAAAFTLIELLVCIAIIGVLIGLLIPGLSAARESARSTVCLSNQRQMILAWQVYADTYRDYAVPYNTSTGPLGSGQPTSSTYWWGSFTGPDSMVVPEDGFLSRFIDSTLNIRSVYECPSQPWGTYIAQPVSLVNRQPTSTYGYNGYYLSPSRVPGYSDQIGFRPWRRTSDIRNPSSLFVFADTMLAGNPGRNCALLDPPELYMRGYGWYTNDAPTTSFRHGGSGAAKRGQGRTVTNRADGSVHTIVAKPEWLMPGFMIGSVGTTNAPHYVPDAAEWPAN